MGSKHPVTKGPVQRRKQGVGKAATDTIYSEDRRVTVSTASANPLPEGPTQPHLESNCLSFRGPRCADSGFANNQVPAESSYRFNIQWLLGISRSMLGGLGNLFSNAFVVFITAVFMLLEAWRMPAKIAVALDGSTATMKHIDEIISNI